jgi:hypothetical protein
MGFLFVVGFDKYNNHTYTWEIVYEIMTIAIMIAYSLMYFGISNSVKRAFTAN